MAYEPTLGEVSRQVESFRVDIRDDLAQIHARLDTYVLREVYLADKAALELRLARMERESEAARSAARAAVYACVGAIVSSLVVGVVMMLLTKGGK
ncbi:hypothetical protein [Spirillospora sp. NBC_01491]|uniref:hypothetical protein n=1 Tax=Spirillospora sp. NBC_01491 TaxID=2976007 RepID=UPI002E3479D6|nr:hypothetical protein [Spirillospora sp. NBC_01491]